jgi:hypothetical protein
MKTINSIIAIVLVLSSFLAKGTIITVSNYPIGAGQYTDVQSAINAASLGDTIYVMGSSIAYNPGGVNITKRVTLIGAGYAVSGTEYNLSTIISGNVFLDSVTAGVPISGTKIIGIGITNYLFSTGNGEYFVNNVLINRCYIGTFGSNLMGSGWVIENSIFYNYLDPHNSTGIINNCVVRNSFLIDGIYSPEGVMNGSGLLVDHNIIEGQIQEINYATITNNIFFYANVSGATYNNYNVYDNNITVNGSADVLPFGTNTGTNNINNVSPSDVFGSGLTAAVSYPALLTTDDWQLVSGSPGHDAALDGTDIGIYGGTPPLPNFTGASTLPQMETLIIKNPNIPVSGTLNYQFKSRLQN